MYRHVDGTFRVVRPPFTQLFSFHAFVKKDGELKHVPLAFVLMSRCRRKDYIRILRALMDVLPQRPSVQAVVSDFQTALWSAVKKVLPGVHHRGCAFHFCQALWRSIQGVGLSPRSRRHALSFKPQSAVKLVASQLSRR